MDKHQQSTVFTNPISIVFTNPISTVFTNPDLSKRINDIQKASDHIAQQYDQERLKNQKLIEELLMLKSIVEKKRLERLNMSDKDWFMSSTLRGK